MQKYVDRFTNVISFDKSLNIDNEIIYAMKSLRQFADATRPESDSLELDQFNTNCSKVF